MSSSPTSSSSSDLHLPPALASFGDVRMQVEVILGKGSMTLRACLGLQRGSVVKLSQSAGQDLFVLFDAYTRKRYEGVKSRDLKTWSGLGAELQMPPGARHGTVFAVPEKILRGLLAAFPPGDPSASKDERK